MCMNMLQFSRPKLFYNFFTKTIASFLSRKLVHNHMADLPYNSTVLIRTYDLQNADYKCHGLHYVYSRLINGTVHKSV